MISLCRTWSALYCYSGTLNFNCRYKCRTTSAMNMFNGPSTFGLWNSGMFLVRTLQTTEKRKQSIDLFVNHKCKWWGVLCGHYIFWFAKARKVTTVSPICKWTLILNVTAAGFLYLLTYLSWLRAFVRQRVTLTYRHTAPFSKISNSAQCGRFALILWRLVKGYFFCVF